MDLSCISWVGSVLLCSTSHTPMVRDWKISHSNEDASSICIPFMETLGCTKITWLYLMESYMMLGAIFTTANAFCTFYDTDYSNVWACLGKRFSYMATYNFCLILLFALKNNPLSLLIGYSHVQLNVLHRLAALMTVLQCIGHMICYCVHLSLTQQLNYLRSQQQMFGWLGLVALLLIILTAAYAPIRKRFYEYFYALHIFLFILGTLLCYFHNTQLRLWMIGCATLWMYDRLLRFARLLLGNRNFFSEYATIHPLPGLATKVVLQRPFTWAPGSHAFLFIPSIRHFQFHPFTISSAKGDLEFIIRAQEGFTLALYKRALLKPGSNLKALVDGPYGHCPTFHVMDRVILIAGGSGATFVFAHAMNILHKGTVKSMDVIWAIKDRRHLTWFTKEIDELIRCMRVRLHIHVSRQDPIIGQTSRREDVKRERCLSDELDGLGDAILYASEDGKDIIAETEEHDMYDGILEAYGADDVESISGTNFTNSATSPTFINSPSESESSCGVLQYDLEWAVRRGRPNFDQLITKVVREASFHEEIGIAACGPSEMMRLVRTVAAKNIRVDGPSITLHCEQFGWW